MPIEALPQTTIRAIGSSSVISDPCSIVKELLDNAIDASASSVVVEVAQNTLDVIQVKDNGHGIPSEDHVFVCKRTFTSKIHTVDDLANIGGKYLGFRGEALASAAEMSGSIAVTTRVGAESVGSSIKYGRNGELISVQPAPHPVGTTVRISDFLKHIPVRRQTALKGTAKALSKMKRMVQAYAMSQPSKRLSFKVLKAKNESNNWLYAPGQNVTLMDAALKVAGSHVASCCMIKSWSSESGSISIEQLVEDTSAYKLMAVLSKPDADLRKVNNAGQYFSVDGRPLSTGRGIGRDITKLYRTYLRATTSHGESSFPITDPFLCLHIHCPQGSYDVNIEPAKDDILFENHQLVVSLVEDLFRGTYGDLPGSANSRQTPGKGKENAASNSGFELLLARKSPDATLSLQHRRENVTSPTDITSPSIWRSSIPVSGRKANLHEETQHQDASTAMEDETQNNNLNSLNPWVITRMNVPNRRPSKSHATESENRRFSIPTIRKEPVELRRNSKGGHRQSTSSSALESPNSIASHSTKSPSEPNHSPPSLQIQAESPTLAVPDNMKRAARERDRERYGNGAIDTWFEKLTGAAHLRDSVNTDAEHEDADLSLTQLAETRFGPQEQQSSNSPRTGAQDSTPTRMRTNGMLGPPSQRHHHSELHSQSPKEGDVGQWLPTPEESPCRQQELSASLTTPGLSDALDFERRKKETIQKHREQKRAGAELPSSTKSLHRSRYLAAKAALSSEYNFGADDQGVSPSEQCTAMPKLNPYDSRAYFMRQNSQQGNTQPKHGVKLQRTQTKKLPLEKIPEGYDLHDVCLRIPVDTSVLLGSTRRLTNTDLYTQSGVEFQAFSQSTLGNDFQSWETELTALVKSKYRPDDGSQVPNIQFDFSAITRHLNDLNSGCSNA